jgi:aldehyde:ferredoxin oxidoreductase
VWEVKGGYTGIALWVDLSEASVGVGGVEEQIRAEFIGGYGVGVRLIYEHQKPGVEALGPENTLGFVAGPLTGTPAIASARFTVMGKSPLTGGWGDANSGGFFGPKMKFAGVDAVFITGMSREPVYLFVQDGRAEIRDASHLWGLDCYETEAKLKEELGRDIAAAVVGPSGERRCLIASVMTDKGRAAGRSGLGALMGSKKLKAIAVKGSRGVPVANEAMLKESRRRYLGTLGVGSSSYDIYRKWGTGGVTASAIQMGDCPVKNWGGSPLDFPNAEAISDDNLIRYQSKKYACWGCPVACGGSVVVPEGPYAGEGAKPQYETLGAFGALCLNDNVESICRLNDICNRNGVDTISAGGTLAFAIECYENQLIGRADTDGIELTWGNHEAIVRMTEKLCMREGFGDLLADGVKAAAARIGRGSEAFAIHVGGQELPMHHPKVFPGLAVTYQIDPTPGRHTQSTEEWTPSFVGVTARDALDYSGRGSDHLKAVAYQQILNCSGLCQLASEAYDAEAILAFMTAVTGWEYTIGRLLADGERIFTLRHLFNLREGLNPANLGVPSRTIGIPPQEEGPLAGVTVGLGEMLSEFYTHVGWDVVSSVPSDSTLERLGLKGLVERFGLHG